MRKTIIRILLIAVLGVCAYMLGICLIMIPLFALCIYTNFFGPQLKSGTHAEEIALEVFSIIGPICLMAFAISLLGRVVPESIDDLKEFFWCPSLGSGWIMAALSLTVVSCIISLGIVLVSKFALPDNPGLESRLLVMVLSIFICSSVFSYAQLSASSLAEFSGYFNQGTARLAEFTAVILLAVSPLVNSDYIALPGKSVIVIKRIIKYSDEKSTARSGGMKIKKVTKY